MTIPIDDKGALHPVPGPYYQKGPGFHHLLIFPLFVNMQSIQYAQTSATLILFHRIKIGGLAVILKHNAIAIFGSKALDKKVLSGDPFLLLHQVSVHSFICLSQSTMPK